jgi:50S ribosomal protein L16 3-hydroxylase
VSFSTPEGGVGPHLDQYDVFITQGLGKRHWRVGKKQAVEDKIPHPDLLQIHSFEACIDEILEPGDVLYIPPGCPHEGYAIENALNYSVGFRAPNQQDFLSSFADYALAEECFKQRYSDSEYRFRDDLATLQINEINKIRELITDCVNDPLHFDTWLGQYLSSAKHDLDIHEPDPALIIEDMQAMLEQINSWRKLGGLRTLIISDRLFINGERWSTSDDMCSFIHYLANTNHYDSLSLKKHTKNLKNLELLTKMVNQGYIYSTENL